MSALHLDECVETFINVPSNDLSKLTVCRLSGFIHRVPHRLYASKHIYGLSSTFSCVNKSWQPRRHQSQTTTSGSGTTSSPTTDKVPSIKLIRNVGVIAHIDAGKTTTTERMLYCAHRTHHLGEVDRGDTVTDYLPEERERGISIVSSTACLNWKQHTLHLIDTPGHVDFTMEVERSLSVLDSALTILDGTKGVEAQTRTVWHQADRYTLPRLVFINKMDRDTANLTKSVATLSTRLTSQTTYVPIHWPVFLHSLDTRPQPETVASSEKHKSKEESNHFVGLVDLIHMRMKIWPARTQNSDLAPIVCNLSRHERDASGPRLSTASMNSVIDARQRLMGQLAEADDEFADQYLALDNPETLLPSTTMDSAIRRATLTGKMVPILIGSGRQGIGIETLLDAIVDYLPDPSKRPLPAPIQQLIQSTRFSRLSRNALSESPHSTGGLPALLVFKICFDPYRGPLSLARVYSGSVRTECALSNWSRNAGVEKVKSIFQLTGQHQEVVSVAGPGSIVALAGLESTHSGDCLGPPIQSNTKADLKRTQKHTSDTTTLQATEPFQAEETELLEFLSTGNNACDPVVYAALEPASLSVVRSMEHALQCLQREDPSFVAKLDPETGQWTVGGMGDLHLEVIESRLQREYKVDARMGPLLIAYKECPIATLTPVAAEAGMESQVNGFGRATGLVDGQKRAVVVVVSVKPSKQFNPQVHFDRSWLGHDTDSNQDATQTLRLQKSVQQSVLSGLQMAGPLLRSPVVGISVNVERLAIGHPDQLQPDGSSGGRVSIPIYSSSAASALTALIRSAVNGAVLSGISEHPDWRLMEPMMSVELRLPLSDSDTQSDSLSLFLGELNARRAEILSVDATNAYSTEGPTDGADHHTIQALAPLASLMGFSTAVRSLSSGRADLHLRLAEYRPVSQEHQTHLLDRFRWIPTVQGSDRR